MTSFPIFKIILILVSESATWIFKKEEDIIMHWRNDISLRLINIQQKIGIICSRKQYDTHIYKYTAPTPLWLRFGFLNNQHVFRESDKVVIGVSEKKS